VTENNIIDLAIVQRERKGKFVLFGELSTDANKEWLITGLLGHAEHRDNLTRGRGGGQAAQRPTYGLQTPSWMV
jgi:hypothetical protein